MTWTLKNLHKHKHIKRTVREQYALIVFPHVDSLGEGLYLTLCLTNLQKRVNFPYFVCTQMQKIY